MTTATKIDHAKMTLEQLQEAHSDMLATATDLGFKVPDELCKEFDTQEAGAALCADVHSAIEKFSAGLDASDEQAAGKKALATETEVGQVATPPAPGPKKSSTKKKSATGEPKQAASTKANKSEAQPAPAASKEKKTVAKKAAVKKTAKKSAKKAVAKKAKAPGTGAHAIKPEGVITVKTKDGENPCKKGSGKHDRVAQIFKFNGKTVEKAVAAGVKKGSLNFCVEQGWIAIK